MRRIRIILASLAVAAVVTLAGPGVSPASAHFCAKPVELNVGERALVYIGVAAEDKPVIAVDVMVPTNFHLENPVGFLGWLGTANGNIVHFVGSVMEPYTCAFFALDGEATKKGRLVAPIVTHAKDGTISHYSSTQPFNPFAAQLIYAGIPIPDPGVTPGGGGSSKGVALAVLVALAAGAVAVGAAALFNRRASSGG